MLLACSVIKFLEEYLYVTRIEIVSYFIYKHVIFLTYKNLITSTNFSTNKKRNTFGLKKP